MAEQTVTLYARLGGYDAIAAVCDDLMSRLMSDSKLGRFWAPRGSDGLRREKQLLIDFLSASAGGPLYYGRKIIHHEYLMEKKQEQTLMTLDKPLTFIFTKKTYRKTMANSAAGLSHPGNPVRNSDGWFPLKNEMDIREK